MKYYILFPFLVLANIAFAQTTRKIVRDFDGDGKKDSVFIDSDKKFDVVAFYTEI